MSLNNIASANRIHIGFFGLRNAGKSSVVNAITNQNMSVVSSRLGTTTDPVRKSMELLPLGPVVIIDTPGLDDEGELGELRVQRTKEILKETDIAVLVVDCQKGMQEWEKSLVEKFDLNKVPYVIVYNKCDLLIEETSCGEKEIYVSAKDGTHIQELKELLGKAVGESKNEKLLVSDLIEKGDIVLLVIPVDEAAPKGRLIMPQQMVLRDVLDCQGIAICCQPEEIEDVLGSSKKMPKLVITDSQAFGEVSKQIPEEIQLTSFSIIMARYKGDLDILLEGAKALDSLKEGDKILIAESCTHHRQCNDIGTVKIPKWIKEYTGAELNFSFVSGMEFPSDLSEYKLIIHCGGCMINEKAMKSRLEQAKSSTVPIVNYGMAIAKMNGILARSMRPFL